MRPPITIEELFKYALVMNLDRDKERLEIMKKSFAKQGLPMPRRIPAMSFRGLLNTKQWNPGRKTYFTVNNAATQLMCVKMAQFLNWPFVCIFEDDAYPRSNAVEFLEKVLGEIPENIQILKLGWAKTKICGLHSYIVFKEVYQTLIGAYAAAMPSYEPDVLMGNYKPIRDVLGYVDVKDGIFIQMNYDKRIGKMRYCLPLKRCKNGTRFTSITPPTGYPPYEEICS